jgi:hypothetical protein
MNKNIILFLAVALIAIGVFKPDITNLLPKPNAVVVDNIVVITPPSDPKVKESLIKRQQRDFSKYKPVGE